MPLCQAESETLTTVYVTQFPSLLDVPVNPAAPRILSRKDSFVICGLLVQDHRLGILYKVTIISRKKESP